MARAGVGAVRVAVTLGDPRGIGPEVAAKAAGRFLAEDPAAEVLFVGPSDSGPFPAPLHEVGAWDGSERSAGVVAAEAIRTAAEMALAGEVHAIVTAPIHKPALRAAGVAAPGHTELLQEIAGAPDVGMLMAAERTPSGPPLRVLLATTHLALRDVPGVLTTELLVRQGRLLDRALRTDWGIPHPRLAFCAFNPHASDDGLFGDEEARVYAPALLALVAEDVGAAGPFPADTVFTRALRGEFDAVVAPYHDVGMAAFKTATFGSGVNVTLGLPFVRTSPDHGTAFDLAGRGTADESSMLEALRLAARLGARRLAAGAVVRGRAGASFDTSRADL